MSNKIQGEANTPEDGMKSVCPMPYSEMTSLCLTFTTSEKTLITTATRSLQCPSQE